MNIFISHASIDKEYGSALVELLTSIGITYDRIIFTSNVVYGIPTGKNIFHWLKTQILNKPFVIYLLSEEYYQSVACMNEMGAAWIVENEHAVIFTPQFKISDPRFQNGALDPREIGFRIDDADRVHEFIDQLRHHFNISSAGALISQRARIFLEQIGRIKADLKPLPAKKDESKTIEFNLERKSRLDSIFRSRVGSAAAQKSAGKTALDKEDEQLYADFITAIITGKLKEDELMLIRYIMDTSRTKLMTGWQMEHEVANIREWEELHGLGTVLSRQHESVLRRWELRKYTVISAKASSGKPKKLLRIYV